MLTERSVDEVNDAINVVFPILMRRRFDKLQRIRILRELLVNYNLPVHPNQQKWFDRWHKTHGQATIDNANILHTIKLNQ